jgi:beta-mannosidase
MNFDGKVIWNMASLVEIPPLSGRDYFNENYLEFMNGKDTRNLVFVAELRVNGEIISKNHYYFRPFKELATVSPVVEHTIARVDSGFHIELTTNKLAKNVYLQMGSEEGFFSDNYFDLLPDEKVTIHLKTEITEAKLREVLTIRTLDDAF